MPNILFFDFDDTLYSHRFNTISEDVQAALSRLHAKKDIIVIISGRGKESEQFIRSKLSIKPDYLVLMNGQIIFREDNLVHEAFAGAYNMKKVMSKAAKLGFSCGGYAKDSIVVNKINSRVLTVWDDFSADLPIVLPNFQDDVLLYQGHLYITKDEAHFFDSYMEDYIVNWSHRYLVNMIPKEAGKSKAIKWCLNNEKINFSNSYAFGDGFNDVDMLLAVAHGVAMGNGSDDLKSVAEYIAPSVDEEGVVAAFRHYNLL